MKGPQHPVKCTGRNPPEAGTWQRQQNPLNHLTGSADHKCSQYRCCVTKCHYCCNVTQPADGGSLEVASKIVWLPGLHEDSSLPHIKVRASKQAKNVRGNWTVRTCIKEKTKKTREKTYDRTLRKKIWMEKRKKERKKGSNNCKFSVEELQ